MVEVRGRARAPGAAVWLKRHTSAVFTPPHCHLAAHTTHMPLPPSVYDGGSIPQTKTSKTSAKAEEQCYLYAAIDTKPGKWSRHQGSSFGLILHEKCHAARDRRTAEEMPVALLC